MTADRAPLSGDEVGRLREEERAQIKAGMGGYITLEPRSNNRVRMVSERLPQGVIVAVEAILAARLAPLLATVEQQAEALGLLRSALERTEANFIRAVNGKPVRDMAETLAENRAALHPAPSVQPDPREEA